MKRGYSKRGAPQRKPYVPHPVASKPQSSNSQSSNSQSSVIRAKKTYEKKPITVSISPDAISLSNLLKTIQYPFPLKNLYISEDKVRNAFESLRNHNLALSRIQYSLEERVNFINAHLTEEKGLIIEPNHINFENSDIVVFNKTQEDYFERDWLSDYFIEHSRLQAKRPKKGDKTGRSPIEEWNLYGTYVQKALDILLKTEQMGSLFEGICRNNTKTLFALREALYGDRSIQECASESPTFLKGVFRTLGDMKSVEYTQLRIFDACAGWGDRLIAAMALEVKEYLGIEPNTNSYTSFEEMVGVFGKNGDYRVLPIAMPLDTNFKYNSYDIAFFSPPSFDSEIYSTDCDQSVIVFSDKSSWINSFLIPSLHQTIESLDIGGYLVVQSILIYIIHPLINYHFGHKVAFQGPLFSNEKGKNRYKPLWIWKKIDKIANSELSPQLISLYDFTHSSIVYVKEAIHTAEYQLSNLFPKNSHKLYFYQGFHIPKTILSDIAKLRYETWKDVAVLNPLYDLSKYESDDKLSEMWLDNDEHDYLHIVITENDTENGSSNIIAACRMKFHRSLEAIPGVSWLYNRSAPLEQGLTSSIERLVVDRRYSRSIVTKSTDKTKGLIYGGGISKVLDTLCIIISKQFNARFVWCDVPKYRINTLTKMGFTLNLFDCKTSHKSRTPNVEWQGMILDMNQYQNQKGRRSFYHNHSAYTFHLPFRNLSDIPRNFGKNLRTFLISGNSGLTKNTLRNILLSNSNFYFVEYDETYFVENKLKSSVDFLSLEWDSSLGSSMNPYFYEVHSSVKNVVDESSIQCITNKMLLHRNKHSSIISTSLLKDVKKVDRPVIIRPVGKNACSSHDVYIVNNDKDLNDVKKYFSQLPPRKYENIIVTDYIRNPMLFDDKKMHIRMYLLVRSSRVDIPAGMFLFPIGKILTAGYPFIDGQYSALPNTEYYKEIMKVHDTHAESTECNLWFPYDLGDVSKDLYVKMWEVCKTLLASLVKDKVKSYAESNNAYEILGLDFMFENEGVIPKLLEVNSKVGFSTIREPTEVNRTLHFADKITESPYNLGQRNMFTDLDERVDFIEDDNLTFGHFSSLIYNWIFQLAILPYLK